MSLSLHDGRPVVRGVLPVTQAEQSFEFTDIAARPVLSLNRGFSAPIKVNANLSAEDLRFLAANDSDAFNRWQAVQTLATALLVDNANALRAGKDPRDDEGLIAALAAILADPALEPAFIAAALTMPSEGDIARDIGREVDPDAIYMARTHLRVTLGLRLGPVLRETYRAMVDEGPFSPDAASAGRRSLKNIALDLLATAGTSAIALASRQYFEAGNMTDRMAALGTLSLYAVPERQAAIDDFYRRYSADPLIIDKWLALQAAIPEAATLDRVRTLTAHPAFSMGNPNRVRALIGSFANANQTQFNRPDGAGYDFVADTVLTLDGKNPQVAARLSTAFRSWRALEPVRRERAEAALRRIAAGDLSPDVADIVARSLATA
jgi:aminopeptidase N